MGMHDIISKVVFHTLLDKYHVAGLSDEEEARCVEQINVIAAYVPPMAKKRGQTPLDRARAAIKG
eukprot:gene592-44603_t